MNSNERNLQAVHVPRDWAADSWRTRPALQLPVYPDAAALAEVQAELHGLPPLVTSWEILALKQQLADAQEGRRFLLQGGDCAESFRECSSSVISNRLKVLLQMSLVLVHGLRLPVVRVGRFAGQYAKPRSADNETIDGVTLPVYRGDIVNAPEFSADARTPDPRRMIKAHARSAMTMNFVRALIDGGFADLHHPNTGTWAGSGTRRWPTSTSAWSPASATRCASWKRCLARKCTTSIVSTSTPRTKRCCCPTRKRKRGKSRDSGAGSTGHALSVDRMRTASVDGAHVEYFRGIRNPIALKVGPSLTPDRLLRLIDALNPREEPGRLTLIHRMGQPMSRRSCRRCWTRCAARDVACCGSATRCTATPKPPATATRPGASATSAANSSSRSSCMPRPERAWAVCTWS
jgi:3-deoxy-7-phosphoheptulonate synthase